MINEKVVGTSYVFQQFGQKRLTDYQPAPEYPQDYYENGNDEPILCRISPGMLVPEPTNAFDPNAVAVYTKLSNGQPFRIGYLKKGSYLYQNVHQNVPCYIQIKGYSLLQQTFKPLSDSYHVVIL